MTKKLDRDEVVEYLYNLPDAEKLEIIHRVNDAKPFIEAEQICVPTCVSAKAKLRIEYEITSLFNFLEKPVDFNFAKGYGCAVKSIEEQINYIKSKIKEDKNCSIVVTNWGSTGKIYLIKHLRNMTGLALDLCRQAIESTPFTLFSGISFEDAALIKMYFEEFGVILRIDRN